MYKYRESSDCYISLHDCRAANMYFESGVLSFVFPNGFWITSQHPQNKSENSVRTTASQADFPLIDKTLDGVEIFIFKKNRKKEVIREEWKTEKVIQAVNSGDFQIEFITPYKSFQSMLFKCWIWFEVSPYHQECEIILNTDSVTYHWDELCYDYVY